MINYLKKPIVIFGLVVIVAVIIGISFAVNNNSSDYETATVEKGTISQEVSVTGKVKPAEEVDLAFEIAGRVKSVYRSVGERVSAGQVLVELDRVELLAGYSQSQAALESANALLLQYEAARDFEQARLEELVRGSREEEIQIKESALAKAQQDLENYYNDVYTTLFNAYNSADDAARKQTDDLFNNDNLSNPSLSFQTTNVQAELDAELGRFEAGQSLGGWFSNLNNLSPLTPKEGLDTALDDAGLRLNKILTFLNRLSTAIDGATSISQSTVLTYKGYVNTGKDNVTASISSVDNLKKEIAAQKIVVRQKQDDLNLIKAGSSAEAIAAQQAKVKQAQANITSQQARIREAQAGVQGASAKLSKTSIKAPIAGILTKQEAKPGQIVAANSNIVSLISDSNFEIEANVPEVDIAKVRLGNSSSITLDAFGDAIKFSASVAKIDPAETIIQGVIYYKITLIFDALDDRPRAGMTANVNILTEQKDGVLIIPQRAVVEESGRTYVRVVEAKTSDKFSERDVSLGLRGNGGMVEVTSGLQVGEVVITFIRK